MSPSERRDVGSRPTSTSPLWDWKGRELATARARARDRRTELRRATIRALIGVAAAILLWRFGHPILASTALVLAIGLLLAARLAPSLHRRIESGLTALTAGVARLLALLFVGLLLYLVFTPLGIFLRATGRLRISLRPTAGDSSSTWREIPAVGPDSYRRLF